MGKRDWVPGAVLCALVLTASVTAGPGIALADSAKTVEERQHERADRMRRDSAARAQSGLGYETLPEQGAAIRTIDFYALSVQAERIGAILREIARAARSAGAGLPGIPAAPGEAGRDIYGPGGPSVKSVQALLSYRLVVLGNPRLAVGKVTEDDKSVTAEIVTAKEGTVVERYVIDKRTGNWTPER